MAEIEVTYDTENNRTYIKVPSRKEKLVIMRESEIGSMYKVLYETGKAVPGLDGNFTDPQIALKQALLVAHNMKESPAVKHDRIFGEENPPKLKRKRVAKNNAAESTANSE